MLKKAAYWFGVVVIGVTVGLSLQFVKAWTEPTVNPPGSNLGTPITKGLDQYKSGALGIGGVLSADGSLRVSDIFAPGGKNILVGDESYLSDVDIANTLGIYGNQDTTQGHIKLGSGGPTISGVGGNIGIGKTTPETSSPNGIAGNIDIKDAYIRATGQWLSKLGSSGSGTTGILYTKSAAGFGPVYCDSGDTMVSGGCWVSDGHSSDDTSAYGGKPIGADGWQCKDWLYTSNPKTYVRCVSTAARSHCLLEGTAYSPGDTTTLQGTCVGGNPYDFEMHGGCAKWINQTRTVTNYVCNAGGSWTTSSYIEACAGVQYHCYPK